MRQGVNREDKPLDHRSGRGQYGQRVHSGAILRRWSWPSQIMRPQSPAVCPEDSPATWPTHSLRIRFFNEFYIFFPNSRLKYQRSFKSKIRLVFIVSPTFSHVLLSIAHVILQLYMNICTEKQYKQYHFILYKTKPGQKTFCVDGFDPLSL